MIAALAISAIWLVTLATFPPSPCFNCRALEGLQDSLSLVLYHKKKPAFVTAVNDFSRLLKAHQTSSQVNPCHESLAQLWNVLISVAKLCLCTTLSTKKKLNSSWRSLAGGGNLLCTIVGQILNEFNFLSLPNRWISPILRNNKPMTLSILLQELPPCTTHTFQC